MEWQEAEKLQDAKQKYNIGLFGNIKMTVKQRRYIDDMFELQQTAERVAEYEDLHIEISKIKDKILSQANERKKAMLVKKTQPLDR